ncbi:MAG: hypothetical protein JJU11_14440 [Candidatus Sumerlaeia bacterium]|nr:hypothetical protein [Candidatus Sumerlaeia bacterium]
MFRFSLLIAVLFSLSSMLVGCATFESMNRGSSAVIVDLSNLPDGSQLTLNGRVVSERRTYQIKNEFRPAAFVEKTADGDTVNHTLPYQLNPWVFGNAPLFLFGILPGVVGVGVDYVTGSWRIYKSPAVFMEGSNIRIDDAKREQRLIQDGIESVATNRY